MIEGPSEGEAQVKGVEHVAAFNESRSIVIEGREVV